MTDDTIRPTGTPEARARAEARIAALSSGWRKVCDEVKRRANVDDALLNRLACDILEKFELTDDELMEAMRTLTF